jgi:hypothetical protein
MRVQFSGLQYIRLRAWWRPGNALASRQGGWNVPPTQFNYTSSKSAVRSGGGQLNSPGSDENAWIIPLEPEETIFIEWRISHYRAMLKLTLIAEDRVNLIRMLVDAEWKLAMRKLYFPKPAELIC